MKIVSLNEARAIDGQVKNIPLTCRISWHTWSLWGRTADGDLQARECVRCGLREVKAVKVRR